jgi:hypothetical protein
MVWLAFVSAEVGVSPWFQLLYSTLPPLCLLGCIFCTDSMECGLRFSSHSFVFAYISKSFSLLALSLIFRFLGNAIVNMDLGLSYNVFGVVLNENIDVPDRLECI